MGVSGIQGPNLNLINPSVKLGQVHTMAKPSLDFSDDPKVIVRDYADPGEQSQGVPISTIDTHGGVALRTPDDIIFERVWVVPVDVDAGFIVSDSQHIVSVWNAFQQTTKPFTAVTSVSPTGTAIAHADVPRTLQPGAEDLLTISVFKNGPSIQSSSYSVTIDGDITSILVHGIRVLAVAPDHNFASDPKLTYSFLTTVFESARTLEQRRPISGVPKRTADVQYLGIGTAGERLFNRLKYGHNKIFGVPIFTESMGASAIPQLGTVITLTTSTDDLWNFNNLSNYIAIVSESTDEIEIQQVSSFTSLSITTINTISTLFDVTKTTIYPIFFGVLQTAAFRQQSDGVDSVSCTFKEIDNE